MIIDTLLTIGAWTAASLAGVSAVSFVAHWVKYSKSEWAKATGNSFLKHIYMKHFRKKAAQKGYIGEHDLSKQLEKIKGRKKILYNVYVPTGLNDKTKTEVDALMIHETGIYVFENKNYSGIIGSLPPRVPKVSKNLQKVDIGQQKWTIFYNNGKSNTMYNPIMQNEKHMSAVKRVMRHLDIPSENFFSYIAFGDSGRIMGAPLSFNISAEGRLLMAHHLAGEINSKLNCRQSILNQEQIDSISSIFEGMAQQSKQVKKEHIRRVSEYRSGQQISSEKTQSSNVVSQSSGLKKPTSPNLNSLKNVIDNAETKKQSQASSRSQPNTQDYLDFFQN